MGINDEKDLILGNLCRALDILKINHFIYRLIPEVRINFVYALANAKSPFDVAAIPGRITAIGDRLIFPSYPQFGASDHMARAMIEIMKFDPNKRAGINFKYTDELRDWIKDYCEKKGLIFGLIDRTKEPKEVSKIDGHSMPWKIKNLIENANNMVPDIFYENEAPGKEPLFVLIGKSAVDVAEKITKIATEFFNK
ncbi:MAG: thiamine-phosphate synthase family protein [Candidatus Hodarchaeota archaeon]